MPTKESSKKTTESLKRNQKCVGNNFIDLDLLISGISWWVLKGGVVMVRKERWRNFGNESWVLAISSNSVIMM
jgi:hypothetical protein